MAVLHTIDIPGFQPVRGLISRADFLYLSSSKSSDAVVSPPVDLLQAFNLRTGARLFTFPLTTDLTRLALDEQSAHLFVCAPFPGRRIEMRNAWSGKLLRTVTFPKIDDDCDSALRIDTANKRMYLVIGNLRSSITLEFDTRSLRLIRAIRPTGQSCTIIDNGGASCDMMLAPVVDDATNRVFVANNDGSVTVFNAHTDRRVATVRLGNHIVDLALVHSSHDVLAATCNEHLGTLQSPDRGTLFALNGASGTILHSVETGVLPSRIIVDDTSQRAYILNVYGEGQRDTAAEWLPNWIRRVLPLAPSLSSSTLAVETSPSTITVIDLRQF